MLRPADGQATRVRTRRRTVRCAVSPVDCEAGLRSRWHVPEVRFPFLPLPAGQHVAPRSCRRRRPSTRRRTPPPPRCRSARPTRASSRPSARYATGPPGLAVPCAVLAEDGQVDGAGECAGCGHAGLTRRTIRTRQECAALFAATGFRLASIYPTCAGEYVIEATPALVPASNRETPSE